MATFRLNDADKTVFTGDAFSYRDFNFPANWLANATAGDLEHWGISKISDEGPPSTPAPLPTISDRQFFQALAMMEMITPQEALAAVRTGEVPATMQTFVDAIEDPQQRFGAQMLLSGATQFERYHPLVAQFGAAFGMDEDQIDDLWRLAASL